MDEPLTDNPFWGHTRLSVLVTGGTGFIGSALVASLLDAGHSVTVLSRSPARAAARFRGRVRCVQSVDQLSPGDGFDAVINLAGAQVVGMPWTAHRKATLLASRLDTTEGLLRWLEKAPLKPTVWIQASAIGFYGVRDPSEDLTEESPAGQGFMAELCVRWEEAARRAQASGVRLVIVRLGIVFGRGGALPALLLPHRLGLGGRLGDGRQIISWVHLADVQAVIARALVDPAFSDVFNLVSPQAVSQGHFATVAAKLLHRNAWLNLPAEPVRWLGGEMAQLFVDGQRVVPARLLARGFTFQFPGLSDALRDLI